jgi:hypothetical protein
MVRLKIRAKHVQISAWLKIPKLEAKLMPEIEATWVKPQDAWAGRRLLVVRLIARLVPTLLPPATCSCT